MSAHPPRGSRGKNVLLILTDQQQADALGCADPSFETPNLDSLAERGIRFTEAYCASGQCTPSRAALMAGRYPHELGVLQIGHSLPDTADTIGKVFEAAGYETAYFGKWHLYAPLERHGFKVTDYRTDGVTHGWIDPTEDSRQGDDALTTARILNYLDDLDRTRPFFAVVSWHAPHPPFREIAPFAERYPLASMPIPESYFLDDLSTKPPWQRARASAGESHLTEELVRKDGRAYRSQVAYVDWNVGRILECLHRNGLMDDTVVAFSTDHGDMQGAHRLRLKGVVPYQELYRVPLILYDPDRPARRVDSSPVSTVSLPATLIDCAGLAIPKTYSGPSLRPILEGSPGPRSDRVFIQHWRAYWGFHPFIGIVTPTWKYVTYLLDREEAELYNRVDDPLEVRNLAHDIAYQSTMDVLRRELRDWWHSTGGLSVTPIQARDGGWPTDISEEAWSVLKQDL